LAYKFSLLPIDIYLPFLKTLNRIIYNFIWGSNWERKSRVNLALSIEEDGAKMLYLPFFISSLQWKHWLNYCNENSFLWKDIEKS